MKSSADFHKWERIVTAPRSSDDIPYNVWRLEVPGGWIYVSANVGVNCGSVFVPAGQHYEER